MSTPAPVRVRHNQGAHRFEVEIDGQLSHVDYSPGRRRIVFTHTEVPRALAGRGIGATLVRAGLDYARAMELRVVSLCPFVSSYLDRHPEYQDMLKAPAF